jgi:hypothetical protein
LGRFFCFPRFCQSRKKGEAQKAAFCGQCSHMKNPENRFDHEAKTIRKRKSDASPSNGAINAQLKRLLRLSLG